MTTQRKGKESRGPIGVAIQVYTLASSRDPEHIRFIGKTVQPHAVLTALRQPEGRRGNDAVREWAAQEIAEGYEMVLTVVFITQEPSEATADLIRRKAAAIEAGHNLLNQQ